MAYDSTNYIICYWKFCNNDDVDKNSFIEEINKQYVMTAKAKGLTNNEVLYKHIFKNALIPILTGFPAQSEHHFSQAVFL